MTSFFNGFSLFFDTVMGPVIRMDKVLGMTLISFVTAVIVLFVYRYCSNQRAISRIKSSIKADLLAISLYKDSMKILFVSAGKIVIKNLRYIQLNLTPLIVMLPVIVLLMANLEGWYGRRPLAVGEKMLAKVALAPSMDMMKRDLKLHSSSAIQVDPYPVRMISEDEIDWRIEAGKKGVHQIRIGIDKRYTPKSVVVGDTVQRIAPFYHQGDLLNALFYPGSIPLDPKGEILSIELTYPAADLDVFGIKMHWMVCYFFLVCILALLMKKRFGVVF